ncbi:MAG: alpha/beta fold hydrolase [Acidimicrobiia bacterium]
MGTNPLGGLESLARDTTAALRRGRTYAIAVREAVGIAVNVVTYPLGILDEALDHAPERRHAVHPVRDSRFFASPAAFDVPVLLVHGYAHNRSGYLLLRNRLRRHGFANLYTLNYNALVQDIPAISQRLADRVECICAETHQPFVHLVGHSLGGIVARYYVQRLGGAERVLRAITIGSPHNGTLSASLLAFLGPTARQLAWNSALIRSLNTRIEPTPVQWTSIWSSSDELVVPAESARLCPTAFRAENLPIANQGHMSLLVSPRVMDIVVDRLGDIDAHPRLQSERRSTLPPTGDANHAP